MRYLEIKIYKIWIQNLKCELGIRQDKNEKKNISELKLNCGILYSRYNTKTFRVNIIIDHETMKTFI